MKHRTPQLFRMRIGSLRKALKSRVEFVFIDAPFLVSFVHGFWDATNVLFGDRVESHHTMELGKGGEAPTTWFTWIMSVGQHADPLEGQQEDPLEGQQADPLDEWSSRQTH